MNRHMVYWATTALTALLFAVSGALLLLKNPHFALEMQRLGYPDYFLVVLGGMKILGVVVILAPGLRRLKEWAYAGLIFDVIGAVCSRAAMGDGALALIPPLLIGALALVSWRLRPDSRRLAD